MIEDIIVYDEIENKYYSHEMRFEIKDIIEYIKDKMINKIDVRIEYLRID